MSDTTGSGAPLPGDMIRWHDGLLLAPLHFQQLDARFEALLTYQLRAAAPFAWGLRRFEARLDGARVLVTALDGIMPDGQQIQHGVGGMALAVTLDAEEVARAPQPYMLYLAVALAGAKDPSGAGPRYGAIDASPDNAQVPRVRALLSLVTATQRDVSQA